MRPHGPAGLRIVRASAPDCGFDLEGEAGEGPTSALVAALLSGERSGISDTVRDLFRETGTIHILSVSGYHVAIAGSLVYLLMGAAARRRPLLAAFLCSLTTGAYTQFSGARPPAVRATVMATAAVFLSALGVRSPGTAVWSLAAAVVLATYPGAAFDAGAQMSFIAVLILIVYRWRMGGGGPGLCRPFWRASP